MHYSRVYIVEYVRKKKSTYSTRKSTCSLGSAVAATTTAAAAAAPRTKAHSEHLWCVYYNSSDALARRVARNCEIRGPTSRGVYRCVYVCVCAIGDRSEKVADSVYIYKCISVLLLLLLLHTLYRSPETRGLWVNISFGDLFFSRSLCVHIDIVLEYVYHVSSPLIYAGRVDFEMEMKV